MEGQQGKNRKGYSQKGHYDINTDIQVNSFFFCFSLHLKNSCTAIIKEHIDKIAEHHSAEQEKCFLVYWEREG